MTQPIPTKNIKVKLLLGCGCFWAFLTGSFFALPSLSPVVGLLSIAMAVGYCGAVCVLGQPIMWFTIGLVTALTIAYVITTNTDFSVINYGVWMTINLNFLVFGLSGVSLRKTMSAWKSWFLNAGAFGGSLGLGWLFILAFS